MTTADVVMVDALDSLPALPRGRRTGEWRLALAGLTAEENQRIERRIKKYRNACGCPQAAAAMSLSGVLYLGFLWAGDLHQPQRLVGEVVTGTGFLFVAGAVGKALGLLWARRRLRRLVLQVRRRIGLRREGEGASILTA